MRSLFGIAACIAIAVLVGCGQGKGAKSEREGLGSAEAAAAKGQGATAAEKGTQPTGATAKIEHIYPIRPGTPEWEAFTSHEAMVRACQIPEGLLKNLSTEELIDAVLDYPLLGDMRLFNSLQMGFDRVSSRFNGLHELLERSDAGPALLARYTSMSPAAIRPEWSLAEKGDYGARFLYMETFLAQDAVMASLSADMRRQLARVALEKAAAKRALDEVYGFGGQKTSAFLLSRTLKKERFTPFLKRALENPRLGLFVESAHLSVRPEIVEETFRAADRFVESVR
jgi:hypothetical protein